ncbi:hypothetical protein KO498_07255 [Lentibacter algarum]|uniref:hypothetical protein n=1 Tax=Lentibacter algarum TaxID=576131 RepID=UPI001C0728A6|nr:hypothetical protein [Lentibacter algarum]MBU2981611.1 hypothetical protein [Lentibacter algarum]
MKNVAKFAAIAMIAAPTFASAGSMTAPADDDTVYVDPTPAGSSAGSLGSMGTGGAIALGLVALAAVAASSGS